MTLFNGFEVCIWFIEIEYLVTVHNRYKILGIREVDDVVCVAGKHVDGLDIVTGDLEFDYFICAEFAFLDQCVSCNHDEKLPFGIVPVLALGNAGLGDIDGDLAAVQRMD